MIKQVKKTITNQKTKGNKRWDIEDMQGANIYTGNSDKLIPGRKQTD